MKNKNYNPFKMWGSYVGAVFGFLLVCISHTRSNVYDTTTGYCSYVFFGYINLLIKENCGGLYFNLIFFSIVLIGFLIGWAIHSLIRRLKNDKENTNS